MNKISIPLGNGRCLVAEKGNDPDHKEIYIGIEKDGCWIQTLSVIGEDEFSSAYKIRVYGEPKEEDYTQAFYVKNIEKYGVYTNEEENG